MLPEIRNDEGERLDFELAPPEEGAPRTVVVIGHGVTANKDRAWAQELARALSEAGHAALRFSFAGNGRSEGEFGASCPTKEARDLGSVLDAVAAEPRLAPHPLVYAGHSMGAAVGVLRASEDARIRGLVSLAGMVRTRAFVERKFRGLRPGDLMWDKPDCQLSQAFLDDMVRVESVLPLAPRVRVPWLLVHGTVDAVVPFEESEAIAAAAGGPVELARLEGADHVFDGPAAEEMAREVVQWLARVELP